MMLGGSLKPIRIAIQGVDKLSATFRKVDRSTATFGTRMKTFAKGVGIAATALIGLGAAAARAGTGLVSGFLDRTSKIQDASDRIGITAERFQELTFIAGQFGVSQEKLEAGLKKFVREGGKVDDLMGSWADKFATIKDGEDAADVLVKKFGKVGQDFSFLRMGGADMRDLAAQARRLGIVMENEVVAQGDDLGDNIEKAKGAFVGLGNTIVTNMLPQLTEATNKVNEFFGDPENRSKVADAFGQISTSLGEVAKAMNSMLPSLEVVNSILKFRNTVASYDPLFGSRAGIVRDDSDVMQWIKGSVRDPFFDWTVRQQSGMGGTTTRLIVETAPGTSARVAPGSEIPSGGVKINPRQGPMVPAVR